MNKNIHTDETIDFFKHKEVKNPLNFGQTLMAILFFIFILNAAFFTIAKLNEQIFIDVQKPPSLIPNVKVLSASKSIVLSLSESVVLSVLTHQNLKIKGTENMQIVNPEKIKKDIVAIKNQTVEPYRIISANFVYPHKVEVQYIFNSDKSKKIEKATLHINPKDDEIIFEKIIFNK